MLVRLSALTLLILLALTAVPSGSWAKTQGTGWVTFQGTDEPLEIRSITFSIGQKVKGGELFNKSHASVAAYQLGMVFVEHGKPTAKSVPGPVTDLTTPIKPGETRGMLDQPLENLPPDKDLAVVGVILLEVRFSDGSSWHNNVQARMAQAEEFERSRVD
jgi:hypothetical protein